MKYRDLWKEENELVIERHELVRDRIAEISKEPGVKAPFEDYFKQTASHILKLEDYYSIVESGKLRSMSMEELKALNAKMMDEFSEENYEKSYANPQYAVKTMGSMGLYLSHVYYQFVMLNKGAILGQLVLLTVFEELYVEIYTRFEEGDIEEAELKKIIHDFHHDYTDLMSMGRITEMYNPDLDYYKDIVDNQDLTDLRYLYYYGVNVTENEIKTAEFINSLPEEDVKAMAKTYVDGFLIGYKNMGKDISKKGYVRLIYALGFEKMMRYARELFKEVGIEGNITPYDLFTTSVNRQMGYDHREDQALFLDKAYMERALETDRDGWEANKVFANKFAGPAVIETFGEKEFDPVNKEEAASFTKEQRAIRVQLQSAAAELTAKYVIPEERSFTIIAYPIPEIGPKFKEIFAETVKVNTLDYKLYQEMQQKIIDVLDQADYVTVKGLNNNRTDLTIKVKKLENPEKESAFENCVADVNIPVGEVFTSPVLKGTNGLLHVTEVYLNGLKVKELEVELTDGMITRYDCKNFEDPAENKKYMDNLVMFQHDTLPIGEFAIGTNTVAYKMGIDYDIQAMLPILIAEKTGPHFAMGDTCYSRSEDTKVYNPDGKEIVARDNEVSILRKEDSSKAYFNCHTDITIPYNELDTITVHKYDGSTEDIIRGGRFVVPGTEELNKPLDEMDK